MNPSLGPVRRSPGAAGSAVPKFKATEKPMMLVAQAYAAGFREAYDVTDPDAPHQVVTQSLNYNFKKWLKRNFVESPNTQGSATAGAAGAENTNKG